MPAVRQCKAQTVGVAPTAMTVATEATAGRVSVKTRAGPILRRIGRWVQVPAHPSHLPWSAPQPRRLLSLHPHSGLRSNRRHAAPVQALETTAAGRGAR